VWHYENGPPALRYSRDFRQAPEELRNDVLVTASNGAQIPLGQAADLGVFMGPSMISSANGLLQAIRLSGNLGTLRGR
jgi:Cu/Ag efflux pump CusA